GETVAALLNEIQRRRIKEPPKSSRVPLWLRRVLVRGLSPAQGDRYESMHTLLHQLAPRQPAWRRRILVAGMLVIFAAALMLGRRQWDRRFGTSGSIRSIAVLPLENLSYDPEQQYLADGMTDGLITALAQTEA